MKDLPGNEVDIEANLRGRRLGTECAAQTIAERHQGDARTRFAGRLVARRFQRGGCGSVDTGRQLRVCRLVRYQCSNVAEVKRCLGQPQRRLMLNPLKLVQSLCIKHANKLAQIVMRARQC